MKLLNKLMIAVFLASISSNLVAMKRDREKDQGPFPDHKRVRIEGSLLRDISDGLELALKNREQDKINELLSNDHVCIDCVMACRVYEFGLDTGNGLITEKMRPFLQWAPLLVFEMNHSRQLAFEMIIQRLHMDDVKVLTLEFDANFNNPNENIERIKSLASIIPSLRQLESFATDMKMTNDSCVQICTGLTRNSRLKHLRLENLSSEQISFLNKIIAGNNNLAELEIRNCTIGTHNIVTFGEAIKKNRTLQELTMDFCDISD